MRESCKKLIKSAVLFATAALAACFMLAAAPETVRASTIAFKQTAQTETSITIAWNAVPEAVSYSVLLTTGSGSMQIDDIYSTSYTIHFKDGLAGVKCYATVVAFDSNDRNIGQTTREPIATIPKVGELCLYKWTPGTAKAELAWSVSESVADPDGYDIEVYNAKKKLMKSLPNTVCSVKNEGNDSYWAHYVFSGTIKNKGFAYRVRPYFKVAGGAVVYGNWSALKSVVPQPKVKGKYTYTWGSSKKSIKLTWKKVTGAKNYTVYYKIGANGKYKKLKTVKGTSFSKSGLSRSKSYYFYVVANKVPVCGKKTNSTIDFVFSVIN